MLNFLDIYCYWLWIISILFYFNIIPYSPLISLIISFSITFIYNLFFTTNVPLNRRIFIIILEFFFVYIVFSKTKKLDIIPNIVLFYIYNLYLFINNKNVINIYVNIFPIKWNNKENIFIFLKNYIKNGFVIK